MLERDEPREPGVIEPPEIETPPLDDESEQGAGQVVIARPEIPMGDRSKINMANLGRVIR